MKKLRYVLRAPEFLVGYRTRMKMRLGLRVWVGSELFHIAALGWEADRFVVNLKRGPHGMSPNGGHGLVSDLQR